MHVCECECGCGCGYVFVRLSFHFDGNSSPTKGSESIHFFYAEIALPHALFYAHQRTDICTRTLLSIPFHSTASHTHTHSQTSTQSISSTHYTRSSAFSHLFVHSHLVFCEMYINGMALTMFLWLLVSSFN